MSVAVTASRDHDQEDSPLLLRSAIRDRDRERERHQERREEEVLYEPPDLDEDLLDDEAMDDMFSVDLGLCDMDLDMVSMVISAGIYIYLASLTSWTVGKRVFNRPSMDYTP